MALALNRRQATPPRHYNCNYPRGVGARRKGVYPVPVRFPRANVRMCSHDDLCVQFGVDPNATPGMRRDDRVQKQHAGEVPCMPHRFAHSVLRWFGRVGLGEMARAIPL